MDTVLTQYETALASIKGESRDLQDKLQKLRFEQQSLQKAILSRRKMLGLVSDVEARKQRGRIQNFGAKSAFVRKLLEENPTGLTGPQIRKKSEGRFTIPSNYPYTILGAWKERGLATKDEQGRYFLIDPGTGTEAQA